MSIQSQREYRKAHKAAGLCTSCTTPAAPGKTKCQRHLDKVITWFAGNAAYARANQKKIRQQRTSRTPEDVAADQRRLRPDGLKWCKKRAEHDRPIPLASFSIERGNADGLRSLCKLCDNGGIRRIAEAYWAAQGIALQCTYCGGPYEHVDHVVPRRRGGTDDPTNLMPSCLPCNFSKKAMPLAQWLAQRFAVAP
jgi:5-methylcytosine-specific restriction endonuclease McrA